MNNEKVNVLILKESNSCGVSAKMWHVVEKAVENLKYHLDTTEIEKLDFQQYESVNKILDADIVIMVSFS